MAEGDNSDAAAAVQCSEAAQRAVGGEAGGAAPDVAAGAGAGEHDTGASTSGQPALTYSVFVFPQRPQAVYRTTQEYAKSEPQCPHSNFLKGVKWSPDGACLLTASDDNWLRLYDLPRDAYCAPALSDEQLEAAGPSGRAHPAGAAAAPPPLYDNLLPALRMHAGETVYDYCWYSRMSSTDPVSCCLAVTTRGHPVHLWDACTGEVRCSYRGYNDADEPTAAYSLAFSPDGARLVAGYNRSMYVFDVARPGRDYKRVNTHKRKQPESLPGIVSCMAFSPGGDLLAAGTYTGALGVYDARTWELLLLLSGNKGGLTQLMFSRDGNYLYTGARQDGQMFCWDVRHTYQSLYVMERDTAATNQRVQFDIEQCGKHLLSGGAGGCATVYDLSSGAQVDCQRLAGDTLNGVALHPCLDLLATASGQRRYREPGGPDEDEPAAVPGGGSCAGGAAAGLAGGGGSSSSGPSLPTNSLMVWRLQQEHHPA